MAPPSTRVSSLLSLDGRCALITGASSGLGAHLAEVLHEAGADVVLCARRADRLEGLAARLNAARGGDRPSAHAVDLDVADPTRVGGCFDRAEACLGQGRVVDVVLNCAGINIFPVRAIDFTDEQYRSIMDVNVRGAFFVAQEAAKRMLKAGAKGSIINVASIHGLRQSKFVSLYAMSKAAVIQMTKNLALEFAHKGVRVNAVAPGYFPSEMSEVMGNTDEGKAYIASTPARRFGELRELDAATLFLASVAASSFITGVCVPVDGGHLVSSL